MSQSGGTRMTGGKPPSLRLPPSPWRLGWKSKPSPNKQRVKSGVFFGLVGVALLVGAARLWGPLSEIRQQGDRIAQLNLKKDALLAEQTDLERYKQRLSTEEGRQAAARRQGYVKKGERRIVFFREKKPVKSDEALDQPQ